MSSVRFSCHTLPFTLWLFRARLLSLFFALTVEFVRGNPEHANPVCLPGAGRAAPTTNCSATSAGTVRTAVPVPRRAVLTDAAAAAAAAPAAAADANPAASAPDTASCCEAYDGPRVTSA